MPSRPRQPLSPTVSLVRVLAWLSLCPASFSSAQTPLRVDSANSPDSWRRAIHADLPSAPTVEQVISWVHDHRPLRPHINLSVIPTVADDDFWTMHLDEDIGLIVHAAKVKPSAPASAEFATPAAQIELFGIPFLRHRIPPDFYLAALAISRAPECSGKVDPVCWIRAVNTLHALGKDRALDALEAFYQADDQPFPGAFPATQILWITQVLFEQEPRGGMPRPLLGSEMLSDFARIDSPLFPVILQDDIPFLQVSNYLLQGVPEDPADRLAFCRNHCRLRDRPLRPTANPVQAAERILARLDLTRPETRNTVQLLHDQARRASENVIDRPREPADDGWSSPPPEKSSEQWAMLVRQLEHTNVWWSPETQDFVRR